MASREEILDAMNARAHGKTLDALSLDDVHHPTAVVLRFTDGSSITVKTQFPDSVAIQYAEHSISAAMRDAVLQRAGQKP